MSQMDLLELAMVKQYQIKHLLKNYRHKKERG